jgi:hypothetical protein
MVLLVLLGLKVMLALLALKVQWDQEESLEKRVIQVLRVRSGLKMK